METSRRIKEDCRREKKNENNEKDGYNRIGGKNKEIIDKGIGRIKKKNENGKKTEKEQMS